MSDDSSKDDDKSLPAIKESRSPVTQNKLVRSISPLGLRVLVKIREKSDMTDGGLYLPENAKDKMGEESLVAEVLEVASALDEDSDEETNISGIPLGSTVLIPKNVGTRVPWDDSMRIVDTKHVLAIIHEISLT